VTPTYRADLDDDARMPRDGAAAVPQRRSACRRREPRETVLGHRGAPAEHAITQPRHRCVPTASASPSSHSSRPVSSESHSQLESGFRTRGGKTTRPRDTAIVYMMQLYVLVHAFGPTSRSYRHVSLA
jgi:hypothetical protein